MHFETYEKRDPFNKEKIRTVQNTDRETYNCGGYALNTMSWIDFYSYGNIEKMSKEIVKAFDNVRIVENYDIKLEDNEYLVAFKTCRSDFHFIKRTKKGMWFHKMGRCGIRRVSEKTVLKEKWALRYKERGFCAYSSIYDSKTVWLAVRE